MSRRLLEGRTAVITGGASGMGRASSVRFAQEGAHVVIVDRDVAATEETVAEIHSAGGSVEQHVLDLSDQLALAPWVERFGHDTVDVLFCHAGVPGPPGWKFDAEAWNETMVVNVWAPMELTRLLLPHLRRSASASCIYTASTSGLRAVPGLLTYAASKSALVGFVRSLAVQLAPEGIRANAICPGATDTPALRRDIEDGTVRASLEAIAEHIPMRRLGSTDDVAGVALFLASDASSYLTGLALPIDGGATA